MKAIKGTSDASGLRFGIVVSRFNKFVTSRLLSSAMETLTKAGACEEEIEVVRVAYPAPEAAH